MLKQYIELRVLEDLQNWLEKNKYPVSVKLVDEFMAERFDADKNPELIYAHEEVI